MQMAETFCSNTIKNQENFRLSFIDTISLKWYILGAQVIFVNGKGIKIILPE